MTRSGDARNFNSTHHLFFSHLNVSLHTRVKLDLYFSFEFTQSLVQLKFTLHTNTQTHEKYSKKGLSFAFELSTLFCLRDQSLCLLLTSVWSTHSSSDFRGLAVRVLPYSLSHLLLSLSTSASTSTFCTST